MDPSWKEPPNAANPGNAESKNTPSAESKNAVNRPPSVKPPLSVAPKASPSPMPFLFPAPPAALSALPQQHQVQPASVAVKATKSPSEDNSLQVSLCSSCDQSRGILLRCSPYVPTQNLLQKAEKELRALRVQKCKIMNKPLAGYRMQQQQQQQQQQQPQPPQQPQQQQQLPQPVSAKPIIKPRQPWIDLVPQNNGASPSPSEPPGSNKPKESKAAAAPVRTPSVEDLIQSMSTSLAVCVCACNINYLVLTCCHSSIEAESRSSHSESPSCRKRLSVPRAFRSIIGPIGSCACSGSTFRGASAIQ